MTINICSTQLKYSMLEIDYVLRNVQSLAKLYGSYFALSGYMCLRVVATSLSCPYFNHPLVYIVCLWSLSLFFVLSFGYVLFLCPRPCTWSLSMLFVIFIGPCPVPWSLSIFSGLCNFLLPLSIVPVL